MRRVIGMMLMQQGRRLHIVLSPLEPQSRATSILLQERRVIGMTHMQQGQRLHFVLSPMVPQSPATTIKRRVIGRTHL